MFCCGPDEPSSPQHKLQQQRLQQQRRRRQQKQSRCNNENQSKLLTPTTARRLADLDHRPATSPRKASRDGGGGTSNSRGRVRLDIEARFKGRPFFKEKHSSDHATKTAEVKVARENVQRASSHDNAIYFRQSDENNEATLPNHSVRNSRSLSSGSQLFALHGAGNKDDGAGYRSQSIAGAVPTRYYSDLKQTSNELLLEKGDNPHPCHHHSLNPKPLHGILKDSNTGNNPATSLYHVHDPNRFMYSELSSHPKGIGYLHNPEQHHRSPNVGGRPCQIYQHVCGAVPASSRSSIPDVYNYGSCLVRTNPDSAAQSDVLYRDKSGHWRPGRVPRKAGSDSGFSVGSVDHSDDNYAVISYKNTEQRATEYANKIYAAVGHNHQIPKPETAQSARRDSHDSLYSVIRPGSVPPQHYSDTEGGRCYRVPRAGSVPVGHESVPTAHNVLGPQQGTNSDIYETASDYVSGSSSSLRSSTVIRQYRYGRGRRSVPRRHTVATADKKDTTEQETEKKREAFMELLAQRYPQYADKIQGSESPTPLQMLQERPSRARDVQRRRTAVATYSSSQSSSAMEYEDLGTMSDLELPSFQRGGYMRTSLPIVRSASTSLERPLGLVFLVYGDQTKKSMLPNEITTLDTVRALFVRAFPDLTLEMLENPRRKIYLLDPATNIYFQLEDLMDIKERSVLKLHETDSDQPQKVREKQEVRGRTVQVPASRPQQTYGELLIGHEFTKSHSLPPHNANNYSDLVLEQRNMWEFERRSRSRTPELAERPRSLSAGSSTQRQRYSHSPDRLPTPERVPPTLNPIPENRQLQEGYREQGNFYETVGPGTYRGQYSNSIYETTIPYQGYPPASQAAPQQTYIARSTRAPAVALPQRAMAPGHDPRDSPRSLNTNRHSLAFTPMSGLQVGAPESDYQHLQNYRVHSGDGVELLHSVTPGDDMTRNRIEKMEQQLANLTKWVHCQKDENKQEVAARSLGSTVSEGSDTMPASSNSSLSDYHDGSSSKRSSGLSSRESTPLSANLEISVKLAQLRSDLHVLRRQQQLNMEAMKDEFLVAAAKIKKVLLTIPGAENQLNFYKRNEAAIAKRIYLDAKEQVEKELRDLESSVEELRMDVISRQCRVNTCHVEGMALLLSNITKGLADLKAQFPEIQNLMKDVMDAEVRVVVLEEKFLKEEPTELEISLKRCKKITGTLYTLKRLASVQDHRPPQVPNIAPDTESSVEDQKKALLENIKSLIPNHEQRVKEMEAADASRARKKKISSQQEALKFGKTLEKASKNLRPPSLTDVRGQADEDENLENGSRFDNRFHSDQAQSVIPTKLATSTTTTHLPTVTTACTKLPSSMKTLVSGTVKPLDKPTATVSAMTAAVSDTITMMATKAAEKESGPSLVKNISIPLTQTTDCLTSPSLGFSETHSVKVGHESPRRPDATVYAYQVATSGGPINTVFPVSNIHKVTDPSSSSFTNIPDYNDQQFTAHNSDNPKYKFSSGDANLPQDLLLAKVDSGKQMSTINSDPFIVATSEENMAPLHTDNEQANSKENFDLAVQKQVARSAFFSSLHTPPDSPLMSPPNKNNIASGQELVSPVSYGVSTTHVSSAHVVSSDISSPKSSVSSASNMAAHTSETRRLSGSLTSSLTSPSHNIPHLNHNNRHSSHDPHYSSSNSDHSSKQKKVPPPPPPRKDSRPTSANISPVNGNPLELSSQHAGGMPRFSGGIMGQHRLSGGPLFSTPKPNIQQKTASRFEQDIASGIYANMNRPDVQNQKSSAQELINEANIPGYAGGVNDPTQAPGCAESPAIPPPPSVTIALDREERAGSSESSSSSSSSGASMGSQQSVISVIRSSSIADKSSTKAKPEPPKRQSSLLAKLTGNKETKNKTIHRKGKSNSVDI